MHLLEADAAGAFSLTYFHDDQAPTYAILSHTWEVDNNQEVTYQDLINGVGSAKWGYRKIQFCSDQAKRDGLRYFWVDSCCINKMNFTELSAAINSMFQYYSRAAKCYVYLSDVSTNKHSLASESVWESAFMRSKWFTRGWTLQELLAPRSVEFFSSDSVRLGDRTSLEQQIQEVTGIPVQALRGSPLSGFSIDERKSWAAKRDTTIKEDQVYCLLGLFDVHLPLIYGEGKENAFRRLHDEIDRHGKVKASGAAQSKDDEKRHQQMLQCLQNLRTSQYEQFKDRNPDRVEGTCQWVLHHEHFQKWQKNRSGLLWVSADPGCGKSVLSKSLVDLEFKTTDSQTTCYFFFKDDNDDQKSITTALSALLHQLFSQRKSLIEHALPEYETEGNNLSKSYHKLWNVLIKAASDPAAGEIICILDALDECSESERYQLIRTLSMYYDARGSGSQLKFFVTSRPYIGIQRHFANLIQNFPTIQLRGEDESKAISHEISIVIKSEVSELKSQLALDDSERFMLEKELLTIEHRTYLWLKLIFEVIRDEVGITKKRLKSIVNKLPATVEDAYEAILSKAKDQKKARKLLHIIIAASRPLTLKEMNIALHIEEYHRSYGDLDLEKLSTFTTTVRNICGLFVSIIDEKVYLIHQTAKEFLLSKGGTTAGRWKYSFIPFESELLMSKICISYLMLTTSENHLIDEKITTFRKLRMAADVLVQQDHGLLEYAARFWAIHFEAVQHTASEMLLQSALSLYDTRSQRFNHWFIVVWNTHPNFTLHSPFSSLLVASYLGHERIVELLLEAGADVHSKDGLDRTPLSWAASCGREAIVKLLLEAKADVNLVSRYGETPLSGAVRNGHKTVVKLLLKAGADFNQNLFGKTLLFHAAANGHKAVVKLLLEARADVDSKYREILPSQAAANSDEAVVKLLLKAAADVNQNPFGETLLFQAAVNGHETIVKLLLEFKADVNLKSRSGETPLLRAAANGHETIVKLLLAFRADVNLESRYGETPLLRAAANGHETVVELLLEAGADVNQNQFGETPLLRAVANGHETVVKLLLAFKADINLESCYGETPLIRAAAHGHETVVNLLLEAGAVIDLFLSEKLLLSWPFANGHEDIVKLLREATADVDS